MVNYIQLRTSQPSINLAVPTAESISNNMTILHVKGQGHRCRMPFKTVPASYIKAGGRIARGHAELFYSTYPSYPSMGTYLVYDTRETALPASKRTFYQFSNYVCAVAKLAELGGDL